MNQAVPMSFRRFGDSPLVIEYHGSAGFESRVESPEVASDPNRNLLFGILAMQMDFISREDLIAATSAWVLDKSRPLDEILLEQGALMPQRHALLAPLVAEHIRAHDNDPEKSLASVQSVGSLRDELMQLDDTDVESSLTHIAANKEADPYATQPFATIGDSTSDGMRFRVLRPHARGGLGQISVARDTELNREVALKEIQSQHADHADTRARFVQEAEITGGLEHPGIVPVYGAGPIRRWPPVLCDEVYPRR